MKIISTDCCDNVKFFGKRRACRCNDYINPLPLWKRLIQVILGVHRENAKSVGEQTIPQWKVRILSFFIKAAPGDAPWKWIVTK
jgi:hypothetical protein